MASRDPRSASRPPQYGHAYPYNDPPVAISPAPPPHPPLPPPVPAAHYPGPPVLANHMLGHPYLQGPWMGANAVPPVFAAPGPGLTLQMGPYSHLMSPMPPPGAGLHFSQPPPASPGVSQYSDALRQPTAASALTTSSKEPQVNPGDARNRPVPTSLQLAGPRNPTVRDIDSVAQPSEMPIGSLVHRMSPPKWGVVKIANIPYSITKQEIIQFLGRQAKLITPDRGWAIHVIMERSTAKTMDCYAEFQSSEDAAETVNRINRIYETGRTPRLGNRHVDVDLSNQDELLKDLFPRAKCVSWRDGMPVVHANTDPYSTGFMGFFTSEEILGAIRHAEIPQRSPFCGKCPQRTYESTISTLYKFPWYATKLYTVHDRNALFELVSRQLKALAARVRRSNTVGLDQRLLRDLLYAGLNCPAFNERQKYTLCVNSEDINEIMRFPEISKWFPFDTLVKVPGFDEQTLLYYADLISRGSADENGTDELPNKFPSDVRGLDSVYGKIWFEWPLESSKNKIWEDAVQHEMVLLCNLVLAGWATDESALDDQRSEDDDNNSQAVVSMSSKPGPTVCGRSRSSMSNGSSSASDVTVSISGTDRSHSHQGASPMAHAHGPRSGPSRRSSDVQSVISSMADRNDAITSSRAVWNLPMRTRHESFVRCSPTLAPRRPATASRNVGQETTDQ